MCVFRNDKLKSGPQLTGVYNRHSFEVLQWIFERKGDLKMFYSRFSFECGTRKCVLSLFQPIENIIMIMI